MADNFTHQDEQCALNRVVIGNRPSANEIKNFVVFRGNAPESIVKISSSEELSSFINIEPHLLSSLTPRLRFFRASYNAVSNTALGEETEFIFNDHFSKQDVERITTSRAGRGFGVGLKSFSFDYTATTPATSDSVIECNLKLHFSSLDDLFTVNESGVAFKDLIVPSSRELGEDQNQPGPTQYNPDYFRIKVVVGYADPIGKIWESQSKSLIEQVKKMKRVFYLTIVKHDLDFKDNGTMTLSIDYHAYVEKALQEDDSDVFRALLSKEGREALDSERNNFKRASKKPSDGEKCKDEDEEESRQEKITESEEKLLGIKGAIYSALLTQMFEDGRLFSLAVPKDKDVSKITEKDGKFVKPVIGNVKNLMQAAIKETDTVENWYPDTIRDERIESALEAQKATEGTAFGSKFLTDSYQFNFFYLGDLLDVALTMLQDDKKRFERTKFLIGDVPYLDTKTNTIKYVNMRDIPISMNVYASWFLDSVVRSGQRDTYPINDFMRDVFNNLVTPVLVPKNCLEDKKNRCGDIGTIRPTFSSEVFEIPILSGLSDLCAITSTDMSVKSGEVFGENIKSVPQPSPNSKNGTYVYYYARSAAETVFSPQAGDSREEGDNKRGIYHFRAARNRGLVKSIKFKKQDQKYLKEARMVKDGGTSTGILRERYNANIVMNGLPTLRPGMLAYIPPDSFGIGSSSMANELGIGGYYSIIKVLNRIDSKFETEIECSWQSNGTGKQDESCCAPKEDPCDQKVEKPTKQEKETKRQVSHNAAVADVKMGMF
jgi:hypothetical protein